MMKDMQLFEFNVPSFFTLLQLFCFVCSVCKTQHIVKLNLDDYSLMIYHFVNIKNPLLTRYRFYKILFKYLRFQNSVEPWNVTCSKNEASLLIGIPAPNVEIQNDTSSALQQQFYTS
ncbi:Hypothetical_protein [Hexamita inflata]|uniref:Hypothetical_protein n=1 Tax=Hexamita inflata TaxID=28002 RepID=A0AA86TYH5_9EUKA|nr:Hypothetical protein HINF_LOCUS20864 [Hexamita inflata]CAI9933221.1 Hypothetical protein HINF_LOCUS20866 [Hexamita inflata]